jgi:hypothetical protein
MTGLAAIDSCAAEMVAELPFVSCVLRPFTRTSSGSMAIFAAARRASAGCTQDAAFK